MHVCMYVCISAVCLWLYQQLSTAILWCHLVLTKLLYMELM